MKLPFKIPSIKFPKFGKKKIAEDEDDFDPSDFEGDDNASLGDLPDSPAGGEEAAAPDADEEAAAEGTSDAPDSGSEADTAGAAEASAEGDGATDSGDNPDIEDIDFGDDDDDDDDGDDDEEAGEKSGGLTKRKKLIIGGGAGAALLLIGGLSWFFMSGDGGHEKAAEEGSGVPMVTMDIAPRKKVQVGGASLNDIVAGAKGPGAGVSAAVVLPAAFASIAPPAVTDGPLAEIKDPALSETSPQGPLPIVAADGRMAWQVYAKPFENQDARPRVSVVISGLGLSKAASDAAIQLLPGNVTLAFDPYAPGLLDWLDKARKGGHEVMMMVPLEPDTFPFSDPGPQGLMTTNAPEENRLRLEYILSRATGYIGVMTSMGSKFNTSEEHVKAFLGEIKLRGLMFFEGSSNSNSLAPKIATEIGLPRALTDIVADSIPTKAAIDDQLNELENILNQQPTAVVIAEAYPASIERLASWITTLESKNFVLAPLSAMADKQFLK